MSGEIRACEPDIARHFTHGKFRRHEIPHPIIAVEFGFENTLACQTTAEFTGRKRHIRAAASPPPLALINR